MHQSCCNNDTTLKVHLSSDGVSETKSTTTSLDVYSIRFLNCRNVYPVCIVRPLKTYPENDFLAEIITELESHGFTISAFLGDNPKRSLARRCLSHSSTFPCEYCFQPGAIFRDVSSQDSQNLTKIQSQISVIQSQQDNQESDIEQLELYKTVEKTLKKSQKKSKIVWPANTRFGPPRSKEQILDILDKLNDNDRLSKKDRKGVVSFSPCLLYTSPSPRDRQKSRMPSSA